MDDQNEKKRAQNALNEVSEKKRRLLQSVQNEPSKYHVFVTSDKHLPDKLKSRETITFTIKPPVLSTLSKVAIAVIDVPALDDIDLSDFKHVKAIATVLAILSHGNSQKKMPDWYVPFLMDNLTPKESLGILQESTLKMGTGFFLTFIRSVKAINPMSLNVESELFQSGSTPTP